MEPKEVIRSQFYAALDMLKEAVTKCPADLWNRVSDKNKTWQVAYHVLFFTHLYLQPTIKDFRRWAKHRENYEGLGKLPEPVEPYSPAEVLEYLDFCYQQVDENVACLDMEAESGFHWLKFNKLGVQIYNIRHIEHHTGELMERLSTVEDLKSWIAEGGKQKER